MNDSAARRGSRVPHIAPSRGVSRQPEQARHLKSPSSGPSSQSDATSHPSSDAVVLHGLLGDLFERARVRDRIGELEPGFCVIGLEPLGLVEARVLERHGRVSGQHLEQSQVALVELPHAQLGQEDDARDARAVAERHRDDGLVHALGARDQKRVLAVEGIGDSAPNGRCPATCPVMPVPSSIRRACTCCSSWMPSPLTATGTT